MAEINVMAGGPFGIDGLLSDEAMASTTGVFVDFIHPALVDFVLFIVVVGDDTVIDSTVMKREEEPNKIDF